VPDQRQYAATAINDRKRMKLPLPIAIKYLLGIYALSPFEEALLQRLGDALAPPDREILAAQMANFNTVRRMLRHVDDPEAHGFTNFYMLRLGKSVTEERQTRRFATSDWEAVLAETHVSFDGGEMAVQFGLVGGVLFSIEYRSPQHIYYPPDGYRIGPVELWPKVASS